MVETSRGRALWTVLGSLGLCLQKGCGTQACPLSASWFLTYHPGPDPNTEARDPQAMSQMNLFPYKSAASNVGFWQHGAGLRSRGLTLPPTGEVQGHSSLSGHSPPTGGQGTVAPALLVGTYQEDPLPGARGQKQCFGSMFSQRQTLCKCPGGQPLTSGRLRLSKHAGGVGRPSTRTKEAPRRLSAHRGTKPCVTPEAEVCVDVQVCPGVRATQRACHSAQVPPP